MARILVIEKDARTQAFLQCRMGPGTKVKLAASMECAWEKIGRHKYDLIVWGASADIAAEVNFSETLKMLSARIGEGKAIVLTDCHKVEPRYARAAFKCDNVQPMMKSCARWLSKTCRRNRGLMGKLIRKMES